MQPDIGENPHKSKSGLMRVWRAFFYSMAGLSAALKYEHAFRQEVMLFTAMLPLALFLPLGMIERLILIMTLLFVLAIELLNSAIEAVVDRVSLENHELSKRAKDFGSAAVFLSMVVAGMAWIFLAGPALLKLF